MFISEDPQPDHLRIHSFTKRKTNNVNYENPASNYIRIQQERRIWLQNEKSRLEEQKKEKELQEVTFHPKLSDFASLKYKDRKRTPEEFYQDNLRWKLKKQSTIEKQKDEIAQQQEIYTFKPSLFTNKKFSKSFYERMVLKEQQKTEHIKDIERSSTPSFKPHLIAKPKQITKEFKTPQNHKANRSVEKKVQQESDEFFNTIKKQYQVKTVVTQENVNPLEQYGCSQVEAKSEIKKQTQRLDQMSPNRDQERQPLQTCNNQQSKQTKMLSTLSFGEEKFQNMLQTLGQDIENTVRDDQNCNIPTKPTRVYFNQKITSITENIQKIFLQQEQRRKQRFDL